jgi:fructose-1,6-bisphosphatase II / sedoheptulose-1,7-bisphosphatase
VYACSSAEIIETETVVMRSTSGTIRWIRAEHRQLHKFG